MMAAGRREILSLYKQLMRESNKFDSYNFRCYAVRRVRDTFKENKSQTDEHKVSLLFEEGKKSFDLIHRQVIIGNLYKDKLPHLLDSLKHA